MPYVEGVTASLATGATETPSAGVWWQTDNRNRVLHSIGFSGVALGDGHLEVYVQGLKEAYMKNGINQSAGRVFNANDLVPVDIVIPAGSALQVVITSDGSSKAFYWALDIIEM